MKLAPTLQGGLRIDADSAADWMMLDAISMDAIYLPGDPLYERLAADMPEDADWEEFVAPDIRNQFSEQVNHVSRVVSSAKKDEEHAGSIFVTKEDATIWYGAVNQARMTLEHIYKVSEMEDFMELEDLDDLDGLEEELASALMRAHFYTTFQCILLEYVLG